MKLKILTIALVVISSSLVAQNQPGLHVDQNHTVLFGNDTTTVGIKTMWLPSKGAFRSGNIKYLNVLLPETIGNVSAAFGGDNQASGNYSFSTGLGNIANSFAEFSIGQYSLSGGGVKAWVVGTDPVFEIGNGTTGTRSNMLTVQKSGNVKIGTMTVPSEVIEERLVVDGGIVVANAIAPNPSNGTIRYNGADLQGRVGGQWKSLINSNGTGGATPWTISGSSLFYNNGDVSVGTVSVIDDFTVGGSVTFGSADNVGISLQYKSSFSLPGQSTTNIVGIGRIWQTQSLINMGIPSGASKLSLSESSIIFDSPDLKSKWGFNFQHSEPNFSTAYRNQTWLKKSWRGDLGDYLYIGSTGNRSITQQSAIVLTQTQGIQFGKGNNNDGDGIGANQIQMGFGTVNELNSTTHLDIKALNNKNVRFYPDGSVGGVVVGGTDLPTGYKLAVDGKIATEEVLVQLSGLWPDYVFKDSYELMELEELDDFISNNGHLPGIPKAEQLENEGVQLGVMQKIQMEKIEELTLYIIELKKEIKKLKSKVDSL